MSRNGFDVLPLQIEEARPGVFQGESPRKDIDLIDHETISYFDADAPAMGYFFDLISSIFGASNMVLIGNDELQMLLSHAILKRQQ